MPIVLGVQLTLGVIWNPIPGRADAKGLTANKFFGILGEISIMLLIQMIFKTLPPLLNKSLIDVVQIFESNEI